MQRRMKWIAVVIVLMASVSLSLLAGQGNQSTQPNHELVSAIVFSKVREDAGCTPALWFELFLMNPDGTNPRQLTDSNGCTHGDTFGNLSPDGKKIVFDSNRLTTSTGFRNVADLFLMNSDGTEQTRLTRGSSATWSPDGKSIAFHASASYHASGGQITLPPINANPGAPTIDSDIFVANADDLLAGATLPTNLTNSEGIVEEDADWSPDGSKIIFTRDPDTDTDSLHPLREIFLINADGTGLRQLTFNGYDERGPAWSPDGTHILFMANVGARHGPNPASNYEICVMDADGTNLVQLTDNAVFDATPTWSPDGQKIAFHKNSPRNQVWTLDADTRCIGGVGCTCSAQLLGGSCERQLTTDRMNLLAHWGQLRFHVPEH